MTETSHPIPQSSQRFRFSRAALGLLAATAVLGVILVFSTLQNINRAQSLMENFLLDKGETIMRSIEAGSRATMMHNMGSSDPLHTLLAEYGKDRDIRYIRISGAQGNVIEHIGSEETDVLSKAELEDILASNIPVSKLDRKAGFFSLSKIFQSDYKFIGMHNHSSGSIQSENGQTRKHILSIGLLTKQFDIARQQDVRHTVFMGAILFLVSSAGLYFLFLYQKIRITSSNLADMKLYTDNVIESIPVGIITLDADDNVVSSNRSTKEIFDTDFSAIEGKNISVALPNCSTSISLACDNSFESKLECCNSSGKTIPLRVSCSPLVNNENERIGKVLILRDMSSLKEMELQLERSRRMAALGKMAAGIAHEIRNPLGTLRGFAQFFGNQQDTTADSKKYSNLMISEIDRLNQTVSGLLQFSRPRDPQFEDVKIEILFEKTVSMMKADLISKKVELLWQKDTDIHLRADPDLLLQLLMNLLKNSINAASLRGRISLQCLEEDHFVTITVSDNGCGMTAETREKMFDPFFTTTRSGTGLGLAVSHQIVEQHNGTFEIQTHPGRGTSISVHLPK